MRKMKRMGMTFLCMCALLTGFALILHGDEGDTDKAIDRQEWKMFVLDFPKAAAAAEYIAYMDDYASLLDTKFASTQSEETAQRLKESLNKVLTLLIRDTSGYRKITTMVMRGWQMGNRAGQEEADNDTMNLEKIQLEAKVDKKIAFIKEFERKYQSILNLDKLPSFPQETSHGDSL